MTQAPDYYNEAMKEGRFLKKGVPLKTPSEALEESVKRVNNKAIREVRKNHGFTNPK